MSWPAILELLPSLDLTARLLLASLAGALLGWERERADKPAGLRTHMLVALGASVFIVTTVEFTEKFASGGPETRLDPTRVIAGIIGGVGFLGAGTIIEARGSVRGITTAATIWLAAAVGTACGMGMFQIAFTSVVLALLILTIFGFLERRLIPPRPKNPPQEQSN